ncbi:TIGR00730 family Rossman fold protein [Paenibacillus sp. Marseille-Q4541]|uniref:LOG family protein n=1 Tax=Paenibacillus sp. Marseille-Q4541 TaxID=2831522 RepID=UPI001BABEFE6
MQSIAVFCGSSTGHDPVYMETARLLGERLANEGITLVYGGSKVGCMGAVADSCLHAGGKVIGVIPEKLKNVEIAHTGLTEIHVVTTMHERKAKMADLADAFIALPGGAGTLEEWFEVFTWAQLGYHQKPCSLLNVNSFYDPLVTMLQHTITEGFMKEAYSDLIIHETTIDDLLQSLLNYSHHYEDKWVSK